MSSPTSTAGASSGSALPNCRLPSRCSQHPRRQAGGDGSPTGSSAALPRHSPGQKHSPTPAGAPVGRSSAPGAAKNILAARGRGRPQVGAPPAPDGAGSPGCSRSSGGAGPVVSRSTARRVSVCWPRRGAGEGCRGGSAAAAGRAGPAPPTFCSPPPPPPPLASAAADRTEVGLAHGQGPQRLGSGGLLAGGRGYRSTSGVGPGRSGLMSVSGRLAAPAGSSARPPGW